MDCQRRSKGESIGSACATISWLFKSIAFSAYLDRIGNSTDTDGALTAPIGFLFWVWLSMIDIILGDKINGQLDIRWQWIQQPGRQS